MRKWTLSVISIACLNVSGCGGGGSGGGGAEVSPPAVTNPPSLTLGASQSTVASGAAVTLSWATTNAQTCSASGGWSGSRPTGGTEQVAPSGPSTTYTLNCVGPGGTVQQQATVSVLTQPTLVLGASPTEIGAGSSTTLNWSATDAVACVASGGWTGLKPVAGNEIIGPISAASDFVLACTGPGGSVVGTVRVTVNSAPTLAPAPTLSLNASPVSVAYGERVTVAWSTTSVSSCMASGSWSGPRATSGTEQSAPLTANAVFTLVCTGSGGDVTRSISVTVASPSPAPTVTLDASPSSIGPGGSATLTWSTTNASACNASGGWSGARSAAGGEQTLTLSATTTFGLTCTGPGGSASASVRVLVTPPAPTITLIVDRSSVISGSKARIDYMLRDAFSCAASGDWVATWTLGGVGSSIVGGRSLGPIVRDSEYRVECTGPGGSTSAVASIRLTSESNDPPVARDDVFTFDEDSGDVFIDYAFLLSNDSDPEGRIGPPRYIEWELVSGAALVQTLYCCSDDASRLGFRLMPDQSGTIVLRYRNQDDIGNRSNWANITVTVRPANDTPVAVDDVSGVIRELHTIIDVLANDRGVDPPVTLEIVVPPSNGTADVLSTSSGPRIRYTPRAGFEGGDSLRYRLRDIDGETAEAAVALTVNPQWQISPARRFVRYGISDPQAWTCSATGTAARTWARAIYGKFKDSFDFIIFLAHSSLTCDPTRAGEHVAAKNDVSGIGRPVYDDTTSFGSAGKLRGVVWMPGISYLRSGPALHELAHNWAQFILNAEPAGIGPHWGFASGGQLGGFDIRTLRDLGGGLYQANNGQPGATWFGVNVNNANGVPYGDTELYLMGMRPAAGTSDFVSFRGAEFVNAAEGIFSATSMERSTIDELIARLGPRVPAYPDAPRDFRILTVVVTRDELTDAQFALVDEHVDLFGRTASDGDARWFNFWEATNGAGRLRMEDIDVELR